jgi:hypothetical protein
VIHLQQAAAPQFSSSTTALLDSASAISPASLASSGEPTDYTHLVPRPEDLNEGEQITQEPADFGDRERTKARYEKAANSLKKSFSLSGGNWEPFDLPEFSDIANNALLQVEEAVETMLTAREKSIKNLEFWSKKKRIVKRIFIMVSPFAKNILQIAKEGSSVLFPFYYHLIAHCKDCFKSVWIALWWIVALDNGSFVRCVLIS